MYPKFAELLRRSGLPQIALKLLFKFVRGKGRNFKPASLQEKEEYAASLISLKATEEAFLLLNELKKENSAKTFLYLGVAHINRWDYENAAIILRKYLGFKNISSYERFIGITNLMASLVANSSQSNKEVKALEEEIDGYLEQALELDYKVLHGNLLEIKSQLIVKSLHRKSPKAILAKASTIINDPSSKEDLFVRKWEIIARKPLLEDGPKLIKKWVKEMEDLRKKAEEINHVETMRDIDFYLGEFYPDLVEKVFFGTPYISFRQKIIEAYGVNLPVSFWLEVDPLSDDKRFEFDYLDYQNLKVGSIVLKVLKALSADFYKRMNKFILFELVFPNDYFNPSSSFNKIHQALKRTRDWLKANHVPLEIKEENEEYFFYGKVDVKVYLNDRVKTLEENKDEHFYFEMNLLKNKFKKESFGIAEAMTCLNHLNSRKTQRFMRKALELSVVGKLNGGKNTRYFFQ